MVHIHVSKMVKHVMKKIHLIKNKEEAFEEHTWHQPLASLDTDKRIHLYAFTHVLTHAFKKRNELIKLKMKYNKMIG